MQGSIREILWHERFICKFLCGIIMNVVAGRGKSLSQTYGDGGRHVWLRWSLSMIADDVIFLLIVFLFLLLRGGFFELLRSLLGFPLWLFRVDKNESILRWIISFAPLPLKAPDKYSTPSTTAWTGSPKAPNDEKLNLHWLVVSVISAPTSLVGESSKNPAKEDKNTFHSHTNWCLFSLWLLHPHNFCCYCWIETEHNRRRKKSLFLHQNLCCFGVKFSLFIGLLCWSVWGERMLWWSHKRQSST